MGKRLKSSDRIKTPWKRCCMRNWCWNANDRTSVMFRCKALGSNRLARIWIDVAVEEALNLMAEIRSRRWKVVGRPKPPQTAAKHTKIAGNRVGRWLLGSRRHAPCCRCCRLTLAWSTAARGWEYATATGVTVVGETKTCRRWNKSWNAEEQSLWIAREEVICVAGHCCKLLDVHGGKPWAVNVMLCCRR